MAAKEAQSTFDLQIKLLLIGGSGVGKTCLLQRYVNNSFSPTLISTTRGIDFKIKTVCLDGKVVKLQIWDTAGQELTLTRFRPITTAYFRGAQGILLVYDVCDRGSFESIAKWIEQIMQHADINAVKILIGNKCDADPSKIQVSKVEGQALADQNNLKFLITSAENDISVTEAFELVARDVANRSLSSSSLHFLPPSSLPLQQRKDALRSDADIWDKRAVEAVMFLKLELPSVGPNFAQFAETSFTMYGFEEFCNRISAKLSTGVLLPPSWMEQLKFKIEVGFPPPGWITRGTNSVGDSIPLATIV